MASRKLFRAGSGVTIGKPGKRPSLGVAPAAAAVAAAAAAVGSKEDAMVDADLTRALKQIFEVRNCNKSSGNCNNIGSKSPSSNNSISRLEESCVTLFGRRLNSPTSTTSSQDSDSKNAAQYSRQGTDKLPPAATAHLLKELHKQRLKQRGITASGNDFPEMGEIEFVHTERRPEVSTLPLLNVLQEKRLLEQDLPVAKRQRIDRTEGLDLSLSTVVGSPAEEVATTDEDVKAMEIGDKRSVKNPEQLTLFYNGQVLVYEDVPSDKAKAIMVLAKSISSKISCYTPAAVITTDCSTLAKAGSLTSVKKDKEKQAAPDVPHQARKASIQRFLEKRKDRYTSKNTNESCEGDKEPFRKEERPGSPLSKQGSGLRCDSDKAAEMQTESANRQWIGV